MRNYIFGLLLCVPTATCTYTALRHHYNLDPYVAVPVGIVFNTMMFGAAFLLEENP